MIKMTPATKKDYEVVKLGTLEAMYDPEIDSIVENVEVGYLAATRVFADEDLDAMYVWQPVFKNKFMDVVPSEFRVTNGHQMLELLDKLIAEKYTAQISRGNVASMYRVPCESALYRNYFTPSCALKSEQEKLNQWICELNSNVIIKIARVEADGKMTKFVTASYNFVTKKVSIDSRQGNFVNMEDLNILFINGNPWNDDANVTKLDASKYHRDDFVEAKTRF